MRRVWLLVLGIALAGCGDDDAPPAGGDADADVDLAAALEETTSTCEVLAGTTPFATDEGEPATVDVCSLPGAVFWRADLDVDCDGGSSEICQADPAYLPETSATDSAGQPLDASTLPFVVVPLASNGFDYAVVGIHLGAVAAVLYEGRLEIGVFGDEGPEGILGEASYAMAERLGIDPDPVTGGADDGAVTVVFQGASAVVDPIEDVDAARTLGQSLLGAITSD